MNKAQKLQFLSDRIVDEKEFVVIIEFTDNFVYKFINYDLLVLNNLGEYQPSLLKIDSLLLRDLKLKPQWTFTEDEKVILRNLPQRYEWIARDDLGDSLCAYENKPKKEKESDEMWSPNIRLTPLYIFNHLFQSIQWSDEEPCEFRKYL